MGLCSSAPPPPDPSEVHAKLEAWCASVRLQFNAMPVLILTDQISGQINIDGDVPSDIRDQFGFVKATIKRNSWSNRKTAVWTIAGNQDPNSKEPFISAAYVLSALVDKHAYKIVGQTATRSKSGDHTIVYAMVKDK